MHFIYINITETVFVIAAFLKLCLLFIIFSQDSRLSVKKHLISDVFLVLGNKLDGELHRISIGQYPLQLLRCPYTTELRSLQILKHGLISFAIPVYSHSRPMVPVRWNSPAYQQRLLHSIKDSQQMVLLTGLVLHEHPVTDIKWCVALPEVFGRWNTSSDLLEVNHRGSITG